MGTLVGSLEAGLAYFGVGLIMILLIMVFCYARAMKLPRFVMLALAIVLVVCAAAEYVWHEKERQFHADSLQIEVETGRAESPMALSTMSELKYDEREEWLDRIAGILAPCTLIAVVVPFAKNGKSPNT